MKIVFVHGAGGCGAMWHYQTGHFPGSVAVTLPGHPEGETRASVAEYAEWLMEYLSGMNSGPVVLAGQSMGGGIALSCALDHPGGIAGLVLIGTGARLRVNPGFLQILSDNRDKPPSWYREVSWPMFSAVEPAVRESVMEKVCSFPVSTHLNDFLCCDRFDVMERVGEIMKPVLIICGEKDIMTPAKYSQYLSGRITGSRLAIISGGGHLVFLEKPDEVNREIGEFMASLKV